MGSEGGGERASNERVITHAFGHQFPSLSSSLRRPRIPSVGTNVSFSMPTHIHLMSVQKRCQPFRGGAYGVLFVFMLSQTSSGSIFPLLRRQVLNLTLVLVNGIKYAFDFIFFLRPLKFQFACTMHSSKMIFFFLKFWVRKHPKPKIVESRMKPISIQ